MGKPIDVHEPLMTRSGCKVELLAVLDESRITAEGETIVALVTDDNGLRTVNTYLPDGRYIAQRQSPLDLVPATVPHLARRILSVVK